jgi:hypothetical protein
MPFSNGILGKTIIYKKSRDGEFAVLVVDKIISDGFSNGSRTKYLVMDSDFRTFIIDATEVKSIVITTEFEKVEDEL